MGLSDHCIGTSCKDTNNTASLFGNSIQLYGLFSNSYIIQLSHGYMSVFTVSTLGPKVIIIISAICLPIHVLLHFFDISAQQDHMVSARGVQG